VKRSLGAVAVLASLVLAAPASAFTPPELYVRAQTWDTHEAAGDWIPLASAPSLNYLGGYQVGYKLQATGVNGNFQRVALTVTGVPDGTPTQPYNAQPFCVGRNGTAGDIVEAGPELQFEGDGTYSVKVSVGDDVTNCLTAGPSSTGSFSVPTAVAPAVVGQPLTFRAKPLAGNSFVGVRAADPPGGFGDVRCTLGGTTVPDVDDFQQAASERVFPRPGTWSCVARGVAEGVDENFDRLLFGTPFSAPLAVEVRSDFRRRLGKVAKGRSKRPRFTFKAEWPGLSNGGRATVTVSRVKGCKGKRYKLRKLGTFRGTFGAKDAQLRMRRPRADGFYIGRFAFSGTRFIRAGVDPTPVYLVVERHRLGFASHFPACS
jgi:hypothetical protein